MDNNQDYLKINQATWDKRTEVHVESKFYDNEAFKAGKCSLNALELEQVGNVEGKSLLHLQCHFGQDTLSWARLGAKVTGVDLSSKAIEQANVLKQELGLVADFVVSDVCEFKQINQQQFDVVFSSYGVLCWLQDLSAWAETIAQALKPGGEFHLVEFHSFNDLLSGYAYFPQPQPDIEQEQTYTENHQGDELTVITWPHSLSEVFTALINAGLSVTHFSEHPYSPYNCIEGATMVPNLGYQLLRNNQQVPLIYAIKAVK